MVEIYPPASMVAVAVSVFTHVYTGMFRDWDDFFRTVTKYDIIA